MRQSDRDDDDRLPVSPRALGVAFGIWVTLMLVLGLVVIPALFALCRPSAS